MKRTALEELGLDLAKTFITKIDTQEEYIARKTKEAVKAIHTGQNGEANDCIRNSVVAKGQLEWLRENMETATGYEEDATRKIIAAEKAAETEDKGALEILKETLGGLLDLT